MSSKIVALSAAAVFASSAMAQQLQINTPVGLTECQPTQIMWTGSNAPFFLSVIPGGQPSAAPLEDLGQQQGPPFKWTVDIAADTPISFELKDSTGAIAYSDQVKVIKGTSDSCVGKGGAAGGSSNSSSSAAPAGGSSSAASSSASSKGSEPSADSSAPAGAAAESSGAPAAASSGSSDTDSGASSSFVSKMSVAGLVFVGAVAALL